MDHLAETLPEEKLARLQLHLDAHPELREELASSASMWAKLEESEVPGPSSVMDEHFQAWLRGKIKSQVIRRPSFLNEILTFFSTQWRPYVIIGAIGFIVGYFFVPSLNNRQMKTLSQEVSEMKQVMLLMMMEQPRAHERIKGVTLTREISQANHNVIIALAKTLNEDPNINVRLAALESLLVFWDDPLARQSIVASIAEQTSPLVQAAMADAMIILREKRAIPELEKLAQREGLEALVLEKINDTVEKLQAI